MSTAPINLRRMRRWASRGDVFIGETAFRHSDVLALVEAVEAAQANREASRDLASTYEFDPSVPTPQKHFRDGTPHSVEEMARRLEAHIEATDRLDAALARLDFGEPA